jgi:cytochrome c biogenesis protein CcmG, thiol:disulfide interchange protein DsbE
MQEDALIPPPTPAKRGWGPKHYPARWIAGTILVLLIAVAVVLATRSPQEATAINSPLVGQSAPTFNQKSFDGQHVALGALRGRYVFVNFYASWCPPCQQEMHDLVAFNNQQNANGPAFVSVAYHDVNSSAKAFMTAHGAHWASIPDPGGQIAERYGVTGPPTTFLVDPNGKITVEPLSGPATSSQLETMLYDAQHSNG